MPNRIAIRRQIAGGKSSYQDIVRRRYLRRLAQFTQRDVVLYSSAALHARTVDAPSELYLINRQDIEAFMAALHGLRNRSLDIIIDSPGGFPEAAAQIVGYLRDKYDHIRAIIPHSAMSAATMIACACDEILMGRQSALGPVDPQITVPFMGGHHTVPAWSILDEFEQARQAIGSSDPSAPLWVRKVDSYPPGIIDQCQKAIDLAREQVENWLTQYMFKTDSNGRDTARQIAEWLADAKQHKSHGRPIMHGELKSKGLRVSLLEVDQKLQDIVLSAFHATCETYLVTTCVKIVESHLGRGIYTMIKPTFGHHSSD